MADDDKTRWAIDVMTAWVGHGQDTDFVHARIDEYLAEPEGHSGLTTGLINLSGLLLMGMEAMLGKSPQEILRTIAVTSRARMIARTEPTMLRFDPDASRETLDHSVMYIFAVALQDGTWHRETSYEPERSHRPDTIELWRKISTVEGPEWTRRYLDRSRRKGLRRQGRRHPQKRRGHHRRASRRRRASVGRATVRPPAVPGKVLHTGRRCRRYC